jgi:peptide/nickel transport system substrate-binding protein
LGQVIESTFDPRARDFNPNIKASPYDPKRAAELLDQAGWSDHDNDGVRDKEGVKFRFEFLVSSGSTTLKQISAVLTEELRKVGVEMTERPIELAVMTQTLKEHRFDASAVGIGTDLVQDPYESWHSSSTVGGINYANFKNAESDRLLEQARTEFDNDKRKEIYGRWQELIREEQPVTFLYHQVETAAYSKRFQNTQWLPLRPGYDLLTWWVPKDRQKYKNGTAP